MGLPTCSIRALPEHHQLLRRIGRALVTRPDLSESLETLIDGATQDVTGPNTAWDQRFEDVERRLTRLEAEAVLRSETRDVLPRRDTRDTVPQHDPPAVTRQPAPPTHTPRPPRPEPGDRPSGANGKRRPLRPWTEADDAELRRIFDQGGTQADACREMDRPSSVISPKWWKLAEAEPAKAEAGQEDREGQRHLSIGEMTAISDEHSEEAYLYQIAGMTLAEAIEQKGWTCEADDLAAAVERWREKYQVLPIEQTRQIAAMQEAGKSPDEIKAWLDRQKAELPASHVDENPAPPED